MENFTFAVTVLNKLRSVVVTYLPRWIFFRWGRQGSTLLQINYFHNPAWSMSFGKEVSSIMQDDEAD
jgi:hypothetical protein